jgi:hypothetical protein
MNDILDLYIVGLMILAFNAAGFAVVLLVSAFNG